MYYPILPIITPSPRDPDLMVKPAIPNQVIYLGTRL
jgi:hypothetical protein